MKNVTVIESKRLLILFSYSTPVAYFDKVNQIAYRTSKKHSQTTTKHINEFFNDYIIGHYLSAFNPIYLEQEILDNKFPIGVSRF